MTDPIPLGMTGQSGFIGHRLAEIVSADPRFRLVPFRRSFFDDPGELASFARQCGRIVHLAAVSRSDDGEALYRTNMLLTEKLIDAVRSCPEPPPVLLGSTVQIAKDLPYHASKRDSAALLARTLPVSVELLMPNTFGPGGRPCWNSVVSTFCEMAARGLVPAEIRPVQLELIFVDELCRKILEEALPPGPTRSVTIPFQYRVSLPELYETLQQWARLRNDKRPLPADTPFLKDLRTTFLAYPYHPAGDSERLDQGGIC